MVRGYEERIMRTTPGGNPGHEVHYLDSRGTPACRAGADQVRVVDLDWMGRPVGRPIKMGMCEYMVTYRGLVVPARREGADDVVGDGGGYFGF